MSDNATNNNAFDKINPSHYKSYSKETIEMMVKVFGVEAVINHCECNAFKYRMRMGTKPNEPVEDDLKKEKWYLDKAKELRNR